MIERKTLSPSSWRLSIDNWLSCSVRSRIHYVSSDVVKGERSKSGWCRKSLLSNMLRKRSYSRTPWCPFSKPSTDGMVKIEIEDLGQWNGSLSPKSHCQANFDISLLSIISYSPFVFKESYFRSRFHCI
jgi:hypothetical protein